MNYLREDHASYLRDVFRNTSQVVDYIASVLANKDYDTIVGTGVSGALLLLMLRDRLGKHVAFVRKRGDGSHSLHKVEGTIGSRYVIVDDQVASGATVNRVVRDIRRVLFEEGFALSDQATFVGVCCYVARTECYVPSWFDADHPQFAESRLVHSDEPTNPQPTNPQPTNPQPTNPQTKKPFIPYEPPKIDYAAEKVYTGTWVASDAPSEIGESPS